MNATGPAANDPGSPVLVVPGRTCGVGSGWGWITQAWALFTRSAVMWIVAIVLFFLMHLALGLIPLVGMFVANIVSPIFMGGIMLGCRTLETGGEMELDTLLAGFRRNTGNLAVLGVLYTVGQVVILLVFGLFVGMGFLMALLKGDEMAMAAAFPADLEELWPFLAPFLLGTLVALALAVPLLAAYWFAPPLVMLHGMAPVQAMRESLFAALRNFLPFLVYGIAMTVIFVIATIPLLLGWFVAFPLLVASAYTSYRGVFTQPEGDD
jgi:uncharacterized membrane protein